MATLIIGPDDRDAAGKIRVDEDRSLADLLPSPASIRADAARVVPQKLSRGEIGALAIVGFVAFFIMAYSWSTPTVAPAQIERAVIMPPTAAPARPTVAPTTEPVRMLGAYAAPDGALLGQIEETRAITPTAHYGGDWVQADVSGSGRVWLRAGDMPNLALVGPDLAPPPPAPQVIYVVQPVQAAPTYSAPVAQPTPDWYTTPPVVQPEFQQALIGSDPNALACNGSPLCGGLTNAEARAAIERQKVQR